MPNETQTALKNALAKARAISDGATAKGGSWSDEDLKQYTGAIDEAKNLKKVALAQAEADSLAEWMAAPDGQSVMPKVGWGGDVLPGEGEQPEVKANGGKFEGELYATGRIGEKKLKTLKSGAYKDAVDEYIRAASSQGRGMKSASMKVLQEGIDAGGGFWVPPDMRQEVVVKMASVINVRKNARSYTTSSEIMIFPKVVYTGDDIWPSGARPIWVAEAPAADFTEATNPIAGRAEIPVQTMVIPIILTRPMIEDSMFDILGYISDLAGQTVGLFEDQAFVAGDGVGKPQGVINHPNATVQTGLNGATGGMRVASGSAASYTWGTDTIKGLTAVEAALMPQYEANAKWYGVKQAYALVRAIADTAGRPLWNVNDQYPTFTNGYAPTLLGYPIVKDAFFQTPTTGNNIGLILGDLQGYYIADRVGLSIVVDESIKRLRDEVVVYVRKRLGGQLVEDWRVKTFVTAAS